MPFLPHQRKGSNDYLSRALREYRPLGRAPVTGSHFFSERQPAAVFKHALLARYLYTFTSKVGSRAPGRKVYFLDAYAGPGAYTNGEPGSPVLAARTAQAAAKIRTERDLRCIYVERDAEAVNTLRETMVGIPHDHEIHHGDIADHLDAILPRLGRSPLLAFFDPFGLTLPLDRLATVLQRAGGTGASGRVPTELLLNFSVRGVVRNAGHLTSKKTHSAYVKARPKLIERADATLGGSWWHPIWEAQAEGAVEEIALGYVQRLATAAGGDWGWALVDVATRWRGPIVYYLIFLTQHHSGLWLFADNLSLAMNEFKEYCLKGQAALPLEDEEQLWVDAIAANLMGLLERGPFVAGDEVPAIYGDTFGWARVKHVAAAVDRLHKGGKSATPRKGLNERTLIQPVRQPRTA